VLDFAFNIHTNIGTHCTGGRVNGKAVPIREKLQTGDTVEIMTGKNQHPTREWLNWVVTSKARTKIKQELDAAERKAAADGREILARKFKNWKIEWTDAMQQEYMKAHRYSNVINFMADISRGVVDVNDIKSFIQQKQEAVASHTDHGDLPEVDHTLNYSAGSDEILVINAKNVKGLDYKLAKCCNPVFGDDVFGFVTRTEGIKIHRMSCPNAAQLMAKYPYRIQKVVWQEGSGNGGDFQVSLNISADREQSVIPDVMGVINRFKTSLRSFNVSENDRNGTYDISVRILVPSNLELDKVISQLSILKHVQKVKRI